MQELLRRRRRLLAELRRLERWAHCNGDETLQQRMIRLQRELAALNRKLADERRNRLKQRRKGAAS